MADPSLQHPNFEEFPVLLDLASAAYAAGGLPAVVTALWERHEALMAKEREHGRRLLAQANRTVPTPGRAGTCPEPACRRRIGLSRHGRLATHYQGTSGPPARCSGTGQRPAEVNDPEVTGEH